MDFRLPVREFSRLVLDENNVGREELRRELAHVASAHLLWVIWSMLVATSAMSGMVKRRIDRPLCHSHSAAIAMARDLLGTASAARFGSLERPAIRGNAPTPPFSTRTTSTFL